MVSNIVQVDSTTDKRKVNKPLIEKKRRARINNCLLQLKTLVLEATGRNSESAVNSKLEKADILEMTVQYLERIQNSRRATQSKVSTVSPQHQAGYILCTNQAVRFLELTGNTQGNGMYTSPTMQSTTTHGVLPNQSEDGLHHRLSAHLNTNIPYQSSCSNIGNESLYSFTKDKLNKPQQRLILDNNQMSPKSLPNVEMVNLSNGSQATLDTNNFSDGNVWRPW